MPEEKAPEPLQINNFIPFQRKKPDGGFYPNTQYIDPGTAEAFERQGLGRIVKDKGGKAPKPLGELPPKTVTTEPTKA